MSDYSLREYDREGQHVSEVMLMLSRDHMSIKQIKISNEIFNNKKMPPNLKVVKFT